MTKRLVWMEIVSLCRPRLQEIAGYTVLMHDAP